MDYKATLLLPKTDFPMRAELPKREPALLARWRAEKVYDRIMAARADADSFVLHDGPPFANGDAHMGHALNMVLKDLVLKVQNMSGRRAPFVPGWDCHGLPIEFKVMKELGANETDPVKIREKCEATARHFIAVQSEQFQRLGVFGDWADPYLTLNPSYEAETLRVFATLVGKGLVYQASRPVLWSTGAQTALAEAEIEYKEKVDPAIYVKFPLTEEAQAQYPELKDASLLVWTTTPWTLPANLAVAVAPTLEYLVIETKEGETVIALSTLLHQFPDMFKVEEGRTTLIRKRFKGSDLIGLTYTHPFLNDGKKRQVFSADFVTAEAGTGLVHIAPGHGQDDYQLGQQHGLPTFAPVDDRGCLTAEFLPADADDDLKALIGQYVFKANAPIIDILKKHGALFAQEEYHHDYPHCWRSKTPIVFRAVKQWFIKIDDFRADALAAIDDVRWIPAAGINRIRGAVATRPDWCISRQRTWGVPLPVFYAEGGQPLLSEDVIRAFATIAGRDGAGVWFSKSSDELAAALTDELAKAGSKTRVPLGLKKGRDTLDVWIDSGTSWAAVSQKRPELTFPADLYLEGSDQHRGWFQSSLLTSVAATGRAPYRAVLTNGFVVDVEGKKLSKSGTGYQKPIDLMTLVNEQGADVLRLWVASQDYQDDIPFSHDIFARVADAYRSIRNTLRILLGNLADFDAARDAVAAEKLSGLDLYIDARFQALVREVLAAYRAYQYSQVYQAVNRFCAVDLSALYVDVLKDRLYCDAPTSPRRRAAQTVMHRVFDGLVKLLAPILAFTAEEAFGFAGRTGSVHLELFPQETAASNSDAITTRWKPILDLRSRVNEKLEEARRAKTIGKSLEARVEIRGISPEIVQAAEKAKATLEDLAELFIISHLELHTEGDAETITVTRAEDHGHRKCVRCWRYYPPETIGKQTDHPELCERCTGAVVSFDSTI
jgi:isoleucyl-tRNA synthetase